MNFVGLATLLLENNVNGGRGEEFMSLEGCILRVHSVLLAWIDIAFQVSALLVAFSKIDVSSQWKGLFTSDGMHAILETEDSQIIGMGGPYICRFVDKCTGLTKDAGLTKSNRMYHELLVDIYWRHWSA